MNKKTADSFLPLTHTTFYTLIALEQPLHGYGIMQKVDEISQGEVKLGPGTLYGALSKLEKQGIIRKTAESDTEKGRKFYALTDLGKQVAQLEFKRLSDLVSASETYIKKIGGTSDGEKGI
ncbi:DNA-binding PadR family transcriptional regulator [Bacillus ectoiniformans]|uniref:PadR family transcriptional regulator n=1 Tax=Bacillus ectoiniformans TaxID=1494429 RepID=UPI00195B9F33|nr:PadR family transcriptional regulator [Bacillus ectoiniformans]MBM7648709.1 DNA-binding PadR family transcriptional regulator [Bacillus ectoiniformans]